MPCPRQLHCPVWLAPKRGLFDSSERGLKDRWGGALFKLLFSHYGQRLPDRSHPLVRLPLLSIGRLRSSRSPIPTRDLGTQSPSAEVSHFAGRTRGPQLRSALSVSTIAFAKSTTAYLRRSAKGGARRLMNSLLLLDRKLLVKEVVATRDYRFGQRISAQCPPIFDTAISRPGPPCPGGAELCFKLSHPVFSGSKLRG